MKPAMILLVALAACSPRSSDNAAEEQAVANVEVAVASTNEVVAESRGLPVTAVVSARQEAKQLPPAFLGRWGITPADCDFSRSDTKGLVTVYPDRLSFYESTAKIDALQRQSPYKVIAALNVTGEGQTWQRRDTLELVSAGTILVRTEPSATYRYERC